MKKKGLFALICSLFSGLCPSSDTESADSLASNEPNESTADNLTGVERYIRRNQADDNTMTGVERYIERQHQQAGAVTGVEKYTQRQTNARQLTGVEKYIRDHQS